MRQYLKPSMFVFSCERLDGRLQGSGAGLLVCEGTECDMTLGASCLIGQGYYYVEIKLFEEGITCPVSALPSCVVETMMINGSSISDPASRCHVVDAQSCDTGCGIIMTCESSIYCNTYSYNDISATVACSGFNEPISCISE